MSDEIKKEEEVGAPAASASVVEGVKVEKKAEEKAEVKAVVPAKFKDIVSKVEEMSVLELHELVKVLEEKFGVSAQAAASAGPAVAAEAAEEKSAFTVELTSAGEQKIAVMKVIKEVLALGLKEAKDLVDGAPSVLKEGMKKEEANDIKKKIEEAGGKVTLK
jgi:large subunit ribosomal protein L7/L12